MVNLQTHPEEQRWLPAHVGVDQMMKFVLRFPGIGITCRYKGVHQSRVPRSEYVGCDRGRVCTAVAQDTALHRCACDHATARRVSGVAPRAAVALIQQAADAARAVLQRLHAALAFNVVIIGRHRHHSPVIYRREQQTPPPPPPPPPPLTHTSAALPPPCTARPPAYRVMPSTRAHATAQLALSASRIIL